VILRNDATRAQVADLAGVSATFSPPMAQVAYLRIPDHEDAAACDRRKTISGQDHAVSRSEGTVE